MRALDLGTGAGFFAFILAELGCDKIVGIDYSDDMINEAKKNANDLGYSKIEFYKMDAQKLTFADNSFDFIITRNVTWTLPRPADAYKEMVRVLDTGGVLINFDANYGAKFKKMDEEDIHASYEAQKNYKYNYIHQTEEQIRERNTIATSLSICEENRPSWDVDVLIGNRVSEVYVDISSNNNGLDGRQPDNSYGMFMVKAVK